MLSIRPAQPADLPAIEQILQTIELFPPEMLGDMMAPYLTDQDSTDHWFVAIEEEHAVAFGYAVQEQLTEGTFNLLAIGVEAFRQGKGIGKQMMAYLEEHLAAKGGRILIVDTSGAEDFAPTRKFYHQLGYAEEARIRDFWAAGEDKVTYWKRIGQSGRI